MTQFLKSIPLKIEIHYSTLEKIDPENGNKTN